MKSTLFNKDVRLLQTSYKRSFFPDQFSNEIYYSSFTKPSKNTPIKYTSNFSIKYVLSGSESYLLNGKKHTIESGKYLLVNDGQEVETKPERNSEGISIFLEKELIAEVYASLISTDKKLIEKEVSSNAFLDIEFFESTFSHSDILGTVLQQISQNIRGNKNYKDALTKESYYCIAEKLILSQKQVQDEIGHIERTKKSTREELYKKVRIAKDYIHDTMLSDFNLELLSKNVGLSKYHLIRVFKSTFSMTPYQYHLFCKVERAKALLIYHSHNLEVIAYICGFNDIFSFSKTFKKVVGVTPSKFRQRYK